MPIKFRCRFCQQFLGISRSRAGAIVDCPQCGRSIRVPELDGRTRRVPAQPRPGRDESLISALSELSELSSLTEQSSGQTQTTTVVAEEIPVTAPEPSSPAFASAPPEISAAPVSTVQVQPTFDAASDATSDQASGPDILTDDDWPSDTVAHQTAAELTPAEYLNESLSEIAALESSPPLVSDELLRDMRDSRRTGGGLGIAVVLLLVGLVGGTAGGWWLTESGYLPALLTETTSERSPAETSGTPPAREEVTHTTASQPVDTDIHAAGSTVSGRIEYVSEAGHLLPDEGALVLLLPRARQGTSLLDGGNLRLSTDAPDFRATVAAMNVLGATATQADHAGRYAVHHTAQGDVQIIVVSQHLQRPVDSPVPRDIQNTLLNWFESPTHVTGQLVVDAQTPTAGTLDFQLGVRR